MRPSLATLLLVSIVTTVACGPRTDLDLVELAESRQALNASYDSTLKVPLCSTQAPVCDSGASLVRGRAALGPEPTYPNTLGATCADGTSGYFHSDESLDALKVSTVDGTDLAPGKSVRIDATVWAYSSYTSDKLDLYYTADASAASPAWTFLTTLTPPGAGARIMSATYTLPAGGAVQAVRGQFRYGGSAAPCVAGGYNDRDDLAFRVAPAAPDTTPPTTSVASPAAGASVSGVVTITANASDNVGVTQVDFYRDGTLLGSDTSAPFSWSWNTAAETLGAHSLSTTAFDAANNSGSSAPVSVTVVTPPLEAVVNGGFEGSIAPWTLVTSDASYVANGTPVHGGTGHVVLHPRQNAGIPMVKQDIAVPAGATLRLWLSVGRVGTQSGAQDNFQVSVVPLDGSSQSTWAYGNLPASGYVEKTIDLAAFAGKNVTLRLEGVSFSDWSGFDPSWGVFFHVDDVSVH